MALSRARIVLEATSPAAAWSRVTDSWATTAWAQLCWSVALSAIAPPTPPAVTSSAFVEARGDRLSGLSRREALKHL